MGNGEVMGIGMEQKIALLIVKAIKAIILPLILLGSGFVLGYSLEARQLNIVQAALQQPQAIRNVPGAVIVLRQDGFYALEILPASKTLKPDKGIVPRPKPAPAPKPGK